MLRLVSKFFAFLFLFTIFMMGYEFLFAKESETTSLLEFLWTLFLFFILWRGTALWAAVRERRAMREKMIDDLVDKKYKNDL